MRRTRFAILIAAAVLSTPAHARDGKVLDTQKVASTAERVVFRVGRDEGRLSSISFRANNDSMLLTAVEIVYGNGERRKVDFLASLKPGAESKPIDLGEDKRAVEQVTVWKRPAFRPWVVGELQLIGVGRGFGGPQAKFEVVDKQTADNRADRIVFRVGRKEGRLTALKFRTTFEPLLISGVEVEYSGRDRQQIKVTDRVLPGKESRVIDLKGDGKRVETVTLFKRPNLKAGRMTVEVLAAEDKDSGPSWAGVGPAIPRGWVLFGAQTVDVGRDRDTIVVGQEMGRFEHIALRVLENDIFLNEITVVYSNGERDRMRIGTEIRANSQTRPIDLKGDRFIRSIELLYQGRSGRRDPAVVEVYGDYAGDWLGGKYKEHYGGWVLLGAQRASILLKDSDTIRVGERFGRVKALKLAAKREDVRIYSARVVYENGEAENLLVAGTVKDGQTTKSIDLKGRGRYIDRIELKYRSKLTLKGQGIIEAWGLL